jgi:cytochrome P450
LRKEADRFIGKKMAMLELRVVITVLVMSFRFEAIPDELNGFQGRTQALRAPSQGFVRLTPLI